MAKVETLANLLKEIRACRYCEQHLPLGPNPILKVHEESRILIVGQAPGTKVHKTSIPWNDPSGVRLREWLQMEPDFFYDETKVGILPMGFCYPGKGERGDLPPRPECAELWQDRVHGHLKKVKLILAVGAYAQKHYLGKVAERTSSDTASDGVTETLTRRGSFSTGSAPPPKKRFLLSPSRPAGEQQPASVSPSQLKDPLQSEKPAEVRPLWSSLRFDSRVSVHRA
ncbi:MAG: uracil-DNA glycosylase family protein [Bacteroidota bacterium]